MKKIIAANWKMNKNIDEALSFVNILESKLTEELQNSEVLIYPPFVSIYPLKDLCSKVKLGAQNFYYKEKGAFTGEISTLMLKGLVDFVLIGHSERRHIFNESLDLINKKVLVAVENDFSSMLCIGESLEEKESGKTIKVLKEQLETAYKDVDFNKVKRLSVAYEPIWAIGTGRVAGAEEIEDIHKEIRVQLKKIAGKALSDEAHILYGGSVKPSNSKELLSKENINGLLIGGASLQINDFFDIIQNSEKINK